MLWPSQSIKGCFLCFYALIRPTLTLDSLTSDTHTMYYYSEEIVNYA